LPPPEINPDSLDLAALKVIARLRRYGHAAYLVGGCVRDLLVGAHPKDYDVATSAHPEAIREVFRNSRLIGRRFRLAHVYFPGGHFVEVATFRASPVPEADPDGDGTGDLLVTDDNQFGTAEEDARRRDFTVNGLFYDVVAGRVIDYVGGREDLRLARIRTIGDPEIRFREDPVRGLRAARIAAKLRFQIDEQTFAAMVRHAGELPRCAPARVLDETLKLLRSGASSPAFRTLRRANLLAYLLPSLDEVIAQGGSEMEAAFLHRLAALDARVAQGEPVSDAVSLAVLLSFLPWAPGSPQGEAEEEEPEDLARAMPSADQVLSRMSADARLPRRVADRVRTIIAAQRIFLAPPKRRRRGSGGFVRAPHFADALELFELASRATGQHADVVARWKAKVAQAASRPATVSEEPVVAVRSEASSDGPAPDALAAANSPPAAADGTIAPPKKRRRRGGRRRRKPEGAATTPPAPPAGGAS
jgi:poly(A) polymerase